jgi:hypothetical protein
MSILSNEAACMECTHGERSFHAQGFIKFEVAFQPFQRNVLQRNKSIKTSACLMYGNAYASQDHFG